jgi:acetoin utilization deacetylase AcuC-like enzyme
VRPVRVGLIDDPVFAGHRPPRAHPEAPYRLALTHRVRAGRRLVPLTPRPALDDEILLAHTESYLEQLLRLEAQGGGDVDPDTYFVADSLEVARLAVGSCLQALEALLAGELDSALAIVRPPGHHACPGHGMGFCLVNNVAVVAAQAVASRKRVAVFDWDVHHGNGTEEAFRDSADVLVVSLHQAPFYPFTGQANALGRGAGRGFTRNIPLPSGLSDADYLYATRTLVMPELAEFAPDLLVVSAGFDAHERDPLGGMLLTAAGFRAMLTLAWQAVQHVPLLLALEGGYSPEAVADSLVACLSEMQEPGAIEPKVSGVSEPVERHVEHVRSAWEEAL